MSKLQDHRTFFAAYRRTTPVGRLAMRDQVLAGTNGWERLHCRFYLWMCDRQIVSEAARDRAKAAL